MIIVANLCRFVKKTYSFSSEFIVVCLQCCTIIIINLFGPIKEKFFSHTFLTFSAKYLLNFLQMVLKIYGFFFDNIVDKEVTN